ncbi:MAG: hypothetical protein IPH13_21565 [Planctomycetes bacterium]|nr:hypothetical protein [Planctomycetota bacterium]MCC7171263.1 hypothetical protein [Planctomycetota bacterium]
MRALVYLALIAVAVAGPILYSTVGGKARTRAKTATAAILAERGAVEALVRADWPPRDGALRAADAALTARRSTVDSLHAAIGRSTADVTDAQLRTLALAVGVDAPVIDSLLAGLTGPSAAARRTVLASVLGGIEPTARVERLHCASLPEPIAGFGLARWRVELAFVASLASAVRTTESLGAGDDRRAPASLIALDLARTRSEEWAELAERFDQPPVRVQATFDVIVDAGGAP